MGQQCQQCHVSVLAASPRSGPLLSGAEALLLAAAPLLRTALVLGLHPRRVVTPGLPPSQNLRRPQPVPAPRPRPPPHLLPPQLYHMPRCFEQAHSEGLCQQPPDHYASALRPSSLQLQGPALRQSPASPVQGQCHWKAVTQPATAVARTYRCLMIAVCHWRPHPSYQLNLYAACRSSCHAPAEGAPPPHSASVAVRGARERVVQATCWPLQCGVAMVWFTCS